MRKLVTVARMYYEDDMNQSEIAKALGVTRPLVSIYLSEAKELGIIEIKINSPFEADNNIMDILCRSFNLKGGSLIKGVNSKSMTEKMIVKSSYEFIKETTRDGDCIGISWGNMIGDVVHYMEQLEEKLALNGTVCSLIGNSATASKNYHTDELCRAFGQAFGCEPHFALAFGETDGRSPPLTLVPVRPQIVKTRPESNRETSSVGHSERGRLEHLRAHHRVPEQVGLKLHEKV